MTSLKVPPPPPGYGTGGSLERNTKYIPFSPTYRHILLNSGTGPIENRRIGISFKMEIISSIFFREILKIFSIVQTPDG